MQNSDVLLKQLSGEDRAALGVRGRSGRRGDREKKERGERIGRRKRGGRSKRTEEQDGNGQPKKERGRK